MKYKVLSLVLVLILVVITLRPSSEPERDYRVEEKIKDYPWVRFALKKESSQELFYIEQIKHISQKDQQIGENIINCPWIKDYISKDEEKALALFSKILDTDIEVAREISESWWFRDEITEDEVEVLEKLEVIDKEVARKIVYSKWFPLFITEDILKSMEIISKLPKELAKEISETKWFASEITNNEVRMIIELSNLFEKDKRIALESIKFLEPHDHKVLQELNSLYIRNPSLFENFLKGNAINRETLYTLSKISEIEAIDREAAENLIGEDLKHISYLAEIYEKDREIGEFVYNEFFNNETALRYLSKYVQNKNFEKDFEILRKTSHFLSSNSEFVYEDRIEKYRYDLITETLKEMPLDSVIEYKKLLYAAVKIYGNRFYNWEDKENGKVYGWSSDQTLSEIEKLGYFNLLNYFIQKNEAGDLLTDIRYESEEYLLALTDIPYNYLINYDGTITPIESYHYVHGIIYNIYSLDARYRRLDYELKNLEIHKKTPLINLIFEDGEERDKTYLLINVKNWNIAQKENACVCQTHQTIMDCIALGIAPSKMYWSSKKTAHLYPAYIPSQKILEEIEKAPEKYGDPFVYDGFISPFDDAGLRDYLNWDIEKVYFYDLEAQMLVPLLERNVYTKIYVFLAFLIIFALSLIFFSRHNQNR